jgi:hypothetical protein
MDWPSTPAYCGAFARAFDVPLFFSWRIGGFEREMLRDSTPTAPVNWENPDGSLGQAGGKGPPGTRLRFPQVSADISARWCSGYLKIDVGVIALRNQPRFLGKKTLFISGERAEESPCRPATKNSKWIGRARTKGPCIAGGRSMPGGNSRSGKSCGDTVSIRIVRDQLRIVTNRAHGRGTDFQLRSVTNRLHRRPPYKRGQLRFAIVARHAAVLMKNPVSRSVSCQHTTVSCRDPNPKIARNTRFECRRERRDHRICRRTGSVHSVVWMMLDAMAAMPEHQ